VTSDNYAGAVAATRHLLDLGHRRIAFLAGRPGLESSALRERGFRETMAAAGVVPDESLVQVGRYSAEASIRPAHELLERPDRPTAVFAANDQSAIEVQHVANELGLEVPRDLSVIGFDDTPEATRADPPLTTVAQPIQQMGVSAVEMLFAVIQGRDAPARITLPTELIHRRSTAPAP
jgi:LacI family transcriptional regulator